MAEALVRRAVAVEIQQSPVLSCLISLLITHLSLLLLILLPVPFFLFHSIHLSTFLFPQQLFISCLPYFLSIPFKSPFWSILGHFSMITHTFILSNIILAHLISCFSVSLFNCLLVHIYDLSCWLGYVFSLVDWSSQSSYSPAARWHTCCTESGRVSR